MADLNEEKEILLPEDDGQQVLDSPSETHELEVSRHVVENSQGTCTCTMSCYEQIFRYGATLLFVKSQCSFSLDLVCRLCKQHVLSACGAHVYSESPAILLE